MFDAAVAISDVKTNKNNLWCSKDGDTVIRMSVELRRRPASDYEGDLYGAKTTRSARYAYSVVRAVVIALIALEYVRDRADFALGVCIVLTCDSKLVRMMWMKIRTEEVKIEG